MTKAQGLSRDTQTNFAIKNEMDLMVLSLMERNSDALAEKFPNADVPEVLRRVRLDIEEFHNYGRNEYDLTFYNDDGSIELGNQGLLDHLNLVRHEMRASANVIASRAFNVDNPAVYDNLRQAVKDMKTLGFTFDETVKMFNQDIKFSKSPTPHPTENLSIEGIKAYMNVMKAAESDPDIREQKIEAAVSDMMLRDDISPETKFSILDEIDLSDLYAENHNMGVNNLERFVEDIIEQEYGERPKISFDATLKSWDYDSDGKNNAEGFAFMAKTASTTMAALNLTIRSIEQAQEQGLIPDSEMARINETLEECQTIHDAMEPVYERSREITQTLALLTPDERGAYYEKVYNEEYETLSNAFSLVYDSVGSPNRGLDFYKDTIAVLRKAVDAQVQDTPRHENPLDDAMRVLRRNGVAMEKGQPRQNDFMHIDIIHNLINHEPFRKLGILSDDELAEIDAVKGYSMPEEKGGLSDYRKHEILDKIASYVELNGNRRDILALLNEANPLEIDSNGYPAQTRSLLDRFMLRSVYPHKYEDSINSDAQPGSDERLHFFFRVFDIKHGSSMSLHEDRGTLPRKPDLTVRFFEHSGGKYLEKMRSYHEAAKLPWYMDRSGGKDMLKSMTGPSDAQKVGGPAAQMEIFWIWGQGVQNAWKHGYYEEHMFGTGMASDRFGADGGTCSDVKAQEMMEIVKEHGPFDRTIPEHRRFMRSALAESFTQQGRHKRYAMSTSGQIADDLAFRMTDKIHKRFELEGLVEPGTHIRPKPKFRNERVENYFHDLRSRWIDRFNRGRMGTTGEFDPKGKSEFVFNEFADRTTCPNIMGFSNHGARPAAKDGSAKQAMNVRAIENQQRHQISQLFAGSQYGSGKMMMDIGYSYRLENPDPNQVKLEDQDIADFLNHEYWDFNIHTKTLAAAEMTNYDYALKQVGWESASFDELYEVGRRVMFVQNPDQEDEVLLVYKGPNRELTNAQLYAAALWHDRLAYIAHMEAALTPEGEGPTLKDSPEDIMKAFRPSAGRSAKLSLGERTKAAWGSAVEIAKENLVSQPILKTQYAREAKWSADYNTAYEAAMKEAKEALAAVADDQDETQKIKDAAAKVAKKYTLERQGGEAGLRRSRSAFRASTLAHEQYWSGARRIGIQPVPDASIEMLMTPKAKVAAANGRSADDSLSHSVGA